MERQMTDKSLQAVQAAITEAGYDPGPADGMWGPKTSAALSSYLVNKGQPVTPPRAGSAKYPKQSGMTAFYGVAGGPDCTAGSAVLPFPFPLAWDAAQRVTRFSCHKLLAAPFTSIFAEAAKHYGEERYRAMRLDQFGGCYNYRKMRNGSSLSIHAWGAAVDLDPASNGLNVKAPAALFSGEEYVPFWNIVEAHGAHSLGREKDYDWMHFQFASF